MEFSQAIRDSAAQPNSDADESSVPTRRISRGGYEQGEARRLARENGGIAVSARPGGGGDRWIIGGWPKADDVWIVTTLDKKAVLFD